MEVHGREIGLMCTVEAHDAISALAHDNNVETVMQMLNSQDTVEQYTTAVLFVAAMSSGYENNRQYEDPDYEPRPVTPEELTHMRRGEFDALFTEAFNTFLADCGITVEAEEPKGKNAAAAADGKSG